MEKMASAFLGEPVLEGLILLPRGSAKKYRASSGGVLGRIASEKLTKDTTPEVAAPGDFNSHAYIALTASRVTLFAVINGVFKSKLGEQIRQFYPGQIDRFEFGAAAAGVGTLDIITSTGDRWAFEYSKPFKRKIVRIAEAVNAIVVDD
jgi:hypothetical protein